MDGQDKYSKQQCCLTFNFSRCNQQEKKGEDRWMDGRKEEGQIQKKQYLIPFDLGNMEDTVNKMSNNMT